MSLFVCVSLWVVLRGETLHVVLVVYNDINCLGDIWNYELDQQFVWDVAENSTICQLDWRSVVESSRQQVQCITEPSWSLKIGTCRSCHTVASSLPGTSIGVIAVVNLVKTSQLRRTFRCVWRTLWSDLPSKSFVCSVQGFDYVTPYFFINWNIYRCIAVVIWWKQINFEEY